MTFKKQFKPVAPDITRITKAANQDSFVLCRPVMGTACLLTLWSEQRIGAYLELG